MQRQKTFNLNRREKNEPHKKTLQNIEINFLNKRQPPSKKRCMIQNVQKKKKVFIPLNCRFQCEERFSFLMGKLKNPSPNCSIGWEEKSPKAQ